MVLCKPSINSKNECTKCCDFCNDRCEEICQLTVNGLSCGNRLIKKDREE